MPQNTWPHERVPVHGLNVDAALKHFVDVEVLAGTEVSSDRFWAGFADLVDELAPRNRTLLDARASMQAAIDTWHREQEGQRHDPVAYEAFLRNLGYLVDEGDDFTIDTEDVDVEIAQTPGPQLVVPVTNARYAINAANARWGSLYDALYGTDAMGDRPPPGDFDRQRGDRVIAWGRDFLDEVFPLSSGSHSDAVRYRVTEGSLLVDLRHGPATSLSREAQFAGHTGPADEPTAVLMRNHGLGVEIVIDREHPVGKIDDAGVADLMLEAAVSVIMDCEDSVAAVDTEDKIAAYRNWLGLMQGTLTSEVEKNGKRFTRRMVEDRQYIAPDGSPLSVHGRALMLLRNVGHLMDTDAVLDRGGLPIPEGFLDAMVSVACALHDLNDSGGLRNSRTGAVYVVKPKVHGPEEAAFVDELFNRVELTLGLAPHTVKVGIMDEERRTSVNLKECIRAVRSRVAFINTGFLDRTGDEIRTSMEAGAMVRKGQMKNQPWIKAYEANNVDVGLACGLPGRAQIGKGMWAAPDLMHAMLEEKVGHPRAGANCAWVPSPTAATLHAIHYHRVDVLQRQHELANRTRAPLADLLTISSADPPEWTDQDRVAELENNAQGILGYVVRWVDQGIGVSKVPDITGVALMEDRATCRISSQHMANWLHHGVTTRQEILDVMRRVAVIVDTQNADDPAYVPMAPDYDGPAFNAAVRLVLEGRHQPSGYTEPILHTCRAERKRLTEGPR